MIGVLVTSHGTMCEGILNSMEMIAGANPDIYILEFDEYNEYVEKLQNQLRQMHNKYTGVLILTDIMSGTPFNECYKYMKMQGEEKIKTVTGMNLPMLVEVSLSLPYEESLENIVSIALDAGKASITEH